MSHDTTLTTTDANTEGDAWAWATEHGAPERASTEQLVSWLAKGELPPHTLVWKPGWSEWMLAMQVAELAAAFPSVTPGSRRVAATARDGQRTPPPVPVAHYPRLRLLARDVVGESAIPSFTGVMPVQAGRRELRDLDHVQQDLVTSQVPVAKMLEAALAMKRQGLASPPRRALSPLALELGFPALLEPEPPGHSEKRYARWLTAGALIVGAVALFLARGPSLLDEAPARDAASMATGTLRAAPAPGSREPRVVTGPCRPPRNTVRLDEWAVRGVTPMLVPLSTELNVMDPRPGQGHTFAAGWVAVGYAQSRENAVGLALSPASLEVERLVSRRRARSIVSVSPTVRDGELVFHSERDGASVAFARLVSDVNPPLRIGMTKHGVVAGRLAEQAKRVWALPPRTVITVPAIAAHTGGLTLATLGGRGQGTVHVGVMSGGGEPLSELHSIGGSGERFGRPALASGGGTTLLAVVGASRGASHPNVWLARSNAGEPPLVLQPFEPMSAGQIGGGAELDGLATAALPGGGFALLFTQGRGGQRRVRLQRFSATLDPLDAPIDITTPEPASRGATVGALYSVGDRLLAFHFLGREGGATSLWVSSIECGGS